MSGASRVLAFGVVAGAAAWGGLSAGGRGITVESLREAAVIQVTMLLGRWAAETPDPAPAGAVIYWRHPDGLPEWSAIKAATSEGRAFLPVRASEDISLDLVTPPAPVAGDGRAILYYRNPMGLADTSPEPKQDSMGMDYISVCAGEGHDDGSVTISPGKLQRTGVRTTQAALARLAASLRTGDRGAGRAADQRHFAACRCVHRNRRRCDHRHRLRKVRRW